MPSSTGSSRACLLPCLRAAFIAVFTGFGAMPAVAALPDYAHDALAVFNAEVPAGWAYTLTTVRNDEARATARFDPDRPPAEQWTLLALNGRAPTAAEASQYVRARAGAGNSVAPQGTFRKGDIDPASYTLIREDAVRGEFTCTFREEATGSDKMLGHLSLLLTISKRPAHVEKAVLVLKEPYSPVLGVKMRELRVEMHFSHPTEGSPSLLSTHHSHFLGRIFFFSVEEDLKLTYTDFARTHR